MNTPQEKIALNTVLEETKVKHISSFFEINDVYDIAKLKDTKVLDVKTTKDTIILFDTPTYNSTYLLDEYKKFLSETTEDNKKLASENLNVLYCDDEIIYKEIFQKYKLPNTIERIVPIILIVTAKEKEIYIIEETFSPLTSKSFFNVFNIIIDSNE